MSIDMSLFECGANRENTNCYKWDLRKEVFGRADVIPMGVADMDFYAPQPVIDALTKRAAYGVFGYSANEEPGKEAVIRWMSRRHGVELKREDILFSPGVVDSMNVALGALTQPGDGVIILTPVYGPFFDASQRNGLNILRCQLLHEGMDWKIDFEALENAFKAGAKCLLLCNPHNPVGRVWTREELTAMVDLARNYGAFIISDEIHADLEMPGHRNTSILLVEPRAIALVSATKTFNLAALRHSSVLIPDAEIRAKVAAEFHRRGINGINLFGALAQETAYNEGEEWLDALLTYLDGTRQAVEEFLKKELPEITCAHLQGTYLMWLDLRALDMEHEQLIRFLVDKAGLGLNDGTFFGEEGRGFMRMNIATPRSNVMRALAQLKAAHEIRLTTGEIASR